MSTPTGAKLYVFAIFAAATAMRATIGDSPLPPEWQSYVSWGLNGLISGLGVILGPELVDGVKTMVGKLAGKE